MEFITLKKYIKNTSTNETILIEHLLNISGRLQTPKRTRNIPTQLGRMKERREKEKRNKKRDQQPWREAEGEGRSPHSEKLPHGGEISWDSKGPFRDLRRIQQMVCGRQDCTHALHHSSVHSSLSRESTVVEGTGCWKVGLRAWTYGGYSCWL